MKNTFIVLFCSLLFASCKQEVKSADIAKLNGYWEIEKVVFEKGEEKEYKMNETFDFFQIKNNKGAVLSVSKELYLKRNTLNGDKLQRITSKNPLKIGDLVTVRLVISTKENVEYIHLKDMRASSFEPVNVLSEYQYKNRLGYYMSTKDAATHFFFDQINKGTYVLEYDIRVNNSGEFSNGITTIQNYYAPQMNAHTKGSNVNISE